LTDPLNDMVGPPPVGPLALILRSVGGIIVGFAVMVGMVMITTPLLTGLIPASSAGPSLPYLILNIIAAFVSAVFGGGACGWLAGRKPMLHAAVLAVGVTILGLSFGVKPGGGQPDWYPWALLLCGPAGVLTGGWLRGRRA
jgi:hypothetical protein